MHLGSPPVPSLPFKSEIEAIKITRVEIGLGLKEARERVEAHVARDPALQELLKSQTITGAFGWLFVIAGAIVAIVYFFPT
jgi:hypothetical protein